MGEAIKMQNTFPHLGFLQPSQATESTSAPGEPQLTPELQLLLSASLDQNLYANQLKNSLPSATSTSSAGPGADFASLLLSLSQQQQRPEPQQTPKGSVEPPTSSGQDDLAQLMALISGPQQSSTSNFLEQMQFFNSQNFGGVPNGPSSQASVVPTTPTSSGSNNTSFFGAGNSASLNSPNKDSYCEFCDKNFCNRYFLKIHKQKKHGIDGGNGSILETPPAKQARLESPVKSSSEEEAKRKDTSADGVNFEAMLAAFQESQNNNNTIRAGHQPDWMNFLQQIVKANSSKSPEPAVEKFSCDKCSQDFATQALLLQHQLLQHPALPAASPPTSNSQPNLLNIIPTSFPSLPFMLPQLQSSFPSLELDSSFGNTSMSNISQSAAPKPTAPKRQYSSTTKNYCDLCNKEVCNKYFLRTHMLKMHNIVIDENKTVIANIDTQEKEKEGSVSFRCDVCHLDMKTRNQLKDHKRTVHGIQPVLVASTNGSQVSRTNSTASKPPSTVNSAIGSGASQGAASAFEFPPASPGSSTAPPFSDSKCPRCEADFESLTELLPHLHTEHASELQPEELIAFLTKAPTSLKCQQCPQTFANNTAFRLHQIEHAAEPNDSHHEEKVSGTEDENDEAMEITREVALKMAAENQAMKMMDQEESAETSPKSEGDLKCSLCRRTYSTKQNLLEHMEFMHKHTVRFSPKKDGKMILSPSKVNKMIKCFTCAKCNQRFASSSQCKKHIVQHLRREQNLADAELKENDILEGASSTTDDLKENKGDFEDELVISFMREEPLSRDKSGTMIEHVVSELSRRGSHGGLAKLPEEKHSHTSGSASPMSVHVPEVYAQPLPCSSSPKPFTFQSFVMRSENNAFSTELHAYLPVRTKIEGPIRVTFDLEPTPNFDAQIKNL